MAETGRVSQATLEVLELGTQSRVSQVLLEVLEMARLTRVSQVTVEVLQQESVMPPSMPPQLHVST